MYIRAITRFNPSTTQFKDGPIIVLNSYQEMRWTEHDQRSRCALYRMAQLCLILVNYKNLGTDYLSFSCATHVEPIDNIMAAYQHSAHVVCFSTLHV